MAAIKFQSLAFQSHKFPSCALLQQTSPKIFMASARPPSSRFRELDNQNKKALSLSHRQTRAQVTHSLPPEKVEIFKSMEDWTRENVLIHLKPVDKCWQPQDFLPDPSSDGFLEQLTELRERAKEIPDDFYVVLVGDMITEEAVPTYESMLNTCDAIGDKTGWSLNPWALWIRGWTAEENRHGDLLNKYLYLSGRVDMGKVEKTIHYLLRRGMDIQAENNPFQGFIYTSFQERATFVSHSNTARLAKHYGDNKLARICGAIASDEKRHEIAYTKLMEKLFEIDPITSVLAFSDMMKKKITMPAHLMFDGQDHNLFSHFSGVARRTGVYTAGDYADIFEHLVRKWNVEKLTGLSGEGRRAQDFLCELGPKIRRIEEKTERRGDQTPVNIPFSWIFNREAKI